MRIPLSLLGRSSRSPGAGCPRDEVGDHAAQRCWYEGGDLGDVGLAQDDARRGRVRLDVLGVLRSRDRDDVLALADQPGDGELGGGDPAGVGETDQPLHDGAMRVERRL